MKQIIPIFLAGLILILLSACSQPKPEDNLVATETAIAGKIYATLTASAPSSTPTHLFTSTPQPSDTPQASATPLPRAAVEAATLNLREGPDTTYPVITTLKQNEEVSVIGQYNQCSWLQIITDGGFTGWAKAGPGYLALPLDCGLIPAGYFRPANGAIIFDRRQKRGLGQLTVDNGTSSDGYVVLVDQTNQPQIGFYVRGLASFTLGGIANGEYQVYFIKGSEWIGDQKTFRQVESIKKMDNRLSYTSTADSFTTWTITLQPVMGGNAQTSDIPPGDFPSIK